MVINHLLIKYYSLILKNILRKCCSVWLQLLPQAMSVCGKTLKLNLFYKKFAEITFREGTT